MERLCFNDCEEFACAISDLYDELKAKDEFNDVTVVANYDTAKELVEELICIGYPIYDVHVCNPDIDAYTREYYISLNSDGVWCERAIGDKGYLWSEAATTFVLDDCNSSILNHIGSENIFEVHIGSCDECDLEDGNEVRVGHDDDCKECDFKDDCLELEKQSILDGFNIKGIDETTECDDEMSGFTVTKETGNSTTRVSFYSTDKDLVKTMAEFYR